MKRFSLLQGMVFTLLLLLASGAMAYQCSKEPTKEAQQFFARVVEHLVKGEGDAVLKVSVEAIQSKAQDFKKMVDYVAGYGEPKGLNLIGYRCYPQDPGYERFYGVLCYPQNKAVGVDMTLTHTSKGLLLRHLRIDVRKGLEQYCQ